MSVGEIMNHWTYLKNPDGSFKREFDPNDPTDTEGHLVLVYEDSDVKDYSVSEYVSPILQKSQYLGKIKSQSQELIISPTSTHISPSTFTPSSSTQSISNPTIFCDVPDITSIKFTNSNTNIPVAPDIGDILKELKEERIELGYNTSDNIYSLINSRAYNEYLNYVKDNEHVRQCSKFGDIYADKNGHEGFKPIMCNDKNRCIIDSGIYVGGLARDAFDLLKAISDTWHNNEGSYLYFLNDTFTLPVTLQNRLYDLGNDGKLQFWDTIKEFYYLLYGGMPAMCINFQTWSTKSPLDKDFIHNHVFGLNLCYNKSRGFYTVDYFVDLDLALSIWYGCVSRLAKKVNINLESSILDGAKSLVWDHGNPLAFNPLAYTTDNNGNKKSNYHLIKHAINYDMRKPVSDIVKFFGSSSYNNSLTLSQQARMDELLVPSDNKKRCAWIGWLADGVKNKYLFLLGLYVKSKKELLLEMKACQEEDAYTCPICGEIMSLKDGRGDLYEIKSLHHSIILNDSMKLGRLQIKRVVSTNSDSARNHGEGFDIVIDALIDAFTSEDYEKE